LDIQQESGDITMKPEWITYKDKRILFTDYSPLSQLEDVMELEKQVTAALKEAEGKMLWLTDFSGNALSFPQFLVQSNNVGRSGIIKDKTHKGALIVLDESRYPFIENFKIISDEFSILVFKTREEALEWLVTE
jgi:hypothetical protein